jgi:hypothetical protein
MIATAAAGPLPPGRYLVQLHATNDPPPTGRFAIERVGTRNVDERVLAEFAVCLHLDALKRDLRTGDRIHAMRRHRGQVRSLVRRVEVTPRGVMLYPLRKARGLKAKPIDAADVAVMGLVTGTYTQFRL